MVRLAIAGADGIALTRIEEPHDPSYTADLLRACHFRTRADLYFIIGADSLAELPSWKDPAEIVRLATLVVFPRDHRPVFLGVPGDASLAVFEAPVIDVSSSGIRASIRAGEVPRDSLAPAVAAYIGAARTLPRHPVRNSVALFWSTVTHLPTARTSPSPALRCATRRGRRRAPYTAS